MTATQERKVLEVARRLRFLDVVVLIRHVAFFQDIRNEMMRFGAMGRNNFVPARLCSRQSLCCRAEILG